MRQYSVPFSTFTVTNYLTLLLSPLLQEYLIENSNLPLPATGRLTIQSAPAHLNATDKTLIAPVSKIVFSDTIPAENELQQLVAFIARKLSISHIESKGLLEKELGLNAELTAGNESINWPEWNLFGNGKDAFNLQQFTLNHYLPALPVEKIFRQPVTEIETVTLPAENTSVDITPEVYPEFEEPVAKDYWWVWALIILVVSVVMVMYRLQSLQTS